MSIEKFKIKFKELTHGWVPWLSITEIVVFLFTRSVKTLTFHTFPPLTTVLSISINFIFAMKANISTKLVFFTAIIKSINAQSLCDSAPCQNGGNCELDDLVIDFDSFSCDCSGTDFLGDFCTILSPCSSTPCQNGGSCHVFTLFADFDSQFCTCQPGFTGDTCEIRDPNIPCQAGFTGDNCEIELPCTSNSGNGPCQNNGTCENFSIGEDYSYTCTCLEDFSGDDCEIHSPCSLSPCSNEGVCTETGTEYTCSCRTSHTGTNCETELPCTANSGFGPCINGAVCTNDVPYVDFGSFSCDCSGTDSGA